MSRLRTTGRPASSSVANWRVNAVSSFGLTRQLSENPPPFFFAVAAVGVWNPPPPPPPLPPFSATFVGKRLSARIFSRASASEAASISDFTSFPCVSIASYVYADIPVLQILSEELCFADSGPLSLKVSPIFHRL